jgi:fluoroquinolone resistance protein
MVGYQNADLVEWSPVDEVFEEVDFSGSDLSSAVIERCSFLRCTFTKARLFGVTFRDCRLAGTQFQKCLVRPMTVEGGDWSYVALRGADLRGVSFAGVRMREADLDGADLSGCDLTRADLSHARVRTANLAGADLRDVELEGVDLSTAGSLEGARIDLLGAGQFARSHGLRVD